MSTDAAQDRNQNGILCCGARIALGVSHEIREKGFRDQIISSACYRWPMSKAPKKMKTLALFNHKGGVGKTTLTVNIADSLADLGICVLVVDADPQCNLSSFYLQEKQLDQLLGESDDVEGGTIWSAIKPVVDGKGPIKDVDLYDIRDNVFLCHGRRAVSRL
jgi:AAA domain